MKIFSKCFILTLSLFSMLILKADQNEISNPFYTLKLKEDKIYVYPKGQKQHVAVIAPNFQNEVPKALIVKCASWQYCKSWVLRTSKSVITVEVSDRRPFFTLCLNRNASPVKVNWQAEAVVIPDVFGEDLFLLPNQSAYKIPPFVNGFMALLKGGNATLSCIPIRANQDVLLAKDQQSLTLYQKNTEDYRFVIKSGKQMWYKTTMPQTPGESKVITDWKVPYSAGWQAAYRFKQGFIPADDGLFNNWSVLEFTKEGKIINKSPASTVSNPAKRWVWHGGYEGNFTQPVEVKDGQVTIRHPKFSTNIERLKYDTATPVYFYAWHTGDAKKELMPFNFVPDHRKGNTFDYTLSVGRAPTTCATTHNFEKLFYDEKAAEKRAELQNSLNHMQGFVESIRGRLENGMEWQRNWRKKLDKIAKRQPELTSCCNDVRKLFDGMEKVYADNRERISVPENMLNLTAEVMGLIDSGLDADQQEEKAKDLGRKIRTIGGGQDNLAAYLRHYGKVIRLYSLKRYMTAKTEDEQEFWSQLYASTENMLQGRYAHDGK